MARQAQGLRASELAAVRFGDIMEALDPEARLLRIHRSKGDQDREGATAFLSPRTVRAVAAWTQAADINEGPLCPGEDLGGIMDALRWKSPRMPLAYNRNLAAEAGAAGRLMAKIG